MQQPSVSDFFKVKKRARESDSSSTTKAKLIAGISSSGRDGPSPVKVEPEIAKMEVEAKPKVVPTQAQAPQVKKPAMTKAQLQAMKALAMKLTLAKTGITSQSQSPAKKTLPSHAQLQVTPVKSPVAALKTISPAKFFSPSRQRDIFSSPVKLCEISSGAVAGSPGRSTAVKRLFNSSGSDSGESPIKKQAPAYQRLHHLAQPTPSCSAQGQGQGQSVPAAVADLGLGTLDVPQDSSLPLPFKYKLLLELFQAVESISSILHNRGELITFEKLRNAVGQLVRRISLKEKHLAQMMTVYPNCYKLNWEKVKEMGGQMSNQLVITVGNSGQGQGMSPSVRAERVKLFRANLTSLVEKEHRKFLATLTPPLIVPEDKKITRFHPKFRIDQVPDIPADLSAPVIAPVEKAQTAKDVMAKAQTMIENANPKMKKALEGLLAAKLLANNASTSAPATKEEKASRAVVAKVSKLKGVSQALIDKIRLREQEKSILSLTQSPEETHRRQMMAQLPDFIKMLRNTMVAEKKTALGMNFVTERIAHSKHGTMSPAQVESHIRLLSQQLPTFINIIRSTQGEFVKINPQLDINDLLSEFKKNASVK